MQIIEQPGNEIVRYDQNAVPPTPGEWRVRFSSDASSTISSAGGTFKVDVSSVLNILGPLPTGCVITGAEMDCPLPAIPPGGESDMFFSYTVDQTFIDARPSLSHLSMDASVILRDRNGLIVLDPQGFDQNAYFAVNGTQGWATAFWNPDPSPTTTADLALSGTVQPEPVASGQSVTYSFTVENLGPQPGLAPQITYALPPGAIVTGGTGCTEAVPTANCTLADIANGATASATVTATLTQSGSMTATVASATTDDDSTNNSISLTDTVLGATDDTVAAVGPITFNVLANDDHTPGLTSLTDAGTGTAAGSVSLDPATGELTYIPTAAEAESTVTVDYIACTSTACSPATVTITIQLDTDGDGISDNLDTDDDNDGNPDTTDPNPLVATATDDSASTVQGTAVTLNLLSNDDFLPGVGTSITRTGGTAAGSVTADATGGNLTYTPAASEVSGSVTVNYEVCNTAVTPAVCGSAVATITITDSGSPIAFDDTADAVQGGPAITIAATANDTLVDNATYSAGSLDQTGTSGTVIDNGDGTFGYTPAAGFSGTDTFTYQVCDDDIPTPTCDTATVTVDVLPDSDGDGIPDSLDTDDDNDGNPDTTDPNGTVATAVDDAGATTPNTAVTVNVLTNDDFIPGSGTSITRSGGTGQGSVVFDSNSGTVRYTPAASETTGSITIDYQACGTSSTPNGCDTATLTVTIQTDTDGDGIPDSTDTDDDNDGNPDTTDPNPLTATATDDATSTVQGTPVTINILANDDFLPGANTTITQTGGTAGGSAAFDASSGELTYTPAVTEVAGSVIIEYEVCNTGATPPVCASAVATITVTDIGTPVAIDDNATAIQNGSAITINVTTNDTLVDNATFSAGSLDRTGTTGTVIEEAGAVSYTPAAGFAGADTFTYQVCDDDFPTPTCDTATVSVTVQTDSDGDGVPDATDPDDDNDGNPDTTDPNVTTATALDDTATTTPNTAVTVNVLTNDDFLAGANTSVTRSGGTGTGTVVFDANSGDLTYTPATAEVAGDTTVGYEVCHIPTSVCATATARISVTDSGTPLATNDVAFAVSGGETINIAVAANDTLVDNATLDPTGLDTSGTAGTVVLAGSTYSYTPAAGFSGPDSFSYRVCDDDVPTPSCSTARVTVNVQLDSDGDGIPDATDADDDNDGNPDTTDQDPLLATARDDTAETQGSNPVIVDILNNDDFLPADTTALSKLPGGTATGTTTFDPLAGQLRYTPAQGEVASVTLLYEACHRPTSVCASATVTILIAVNGSITGVVHLDTNRDEAATNDAQIAGVTVELRNAAGLLLQTAVTASPYFFTNLADGFYTVTIVEGTLPTGTYPTTATSVNLSTETGSSVTQNFGVAYALITGTARMFDGSTVSGAVVRISDSLGNLHAATTESDGSYRIQGDAQNPLVEGMVSLVSTISGAAISGQTQLTGGVPLVFDLLGPELEVSEAALPATSQPPITLAFTGSMSTYLLLAALILLEGGALLLSAIDRRWPVA